MTYKSTHDPTRRRKALQGALKRLEKRVDPYGEYSRQASEDLQVIQEAFINGVVDYDDKTHLLNLVNKHEENNKKRFKERLQRQEEAELKRRAKLIDKEIDALPQVSISGFIMACFILWFLFG